MITTVVVAEFDLTCIATQGLLLALTVHDWPVLHQLPIASPTRIGGAVLASPELVA